MVSLLQTDEKQDAFIKIVIGLPYFSLTHFCKVANMQNRGI